MKNLRIAKSEVRILNELHRRANCTLFKALVRGRECVLKVYKNDPFAEIPIFNRERDAYLRLKARGLCAAGVVPMYYGAVENIGIAEWTPHLDMFKGLVDCKNVLDANVIEYFPDLREMDLPTYSKERMQQAISILRQIHAAGVLHGDPYPRNIMVTGENPGKVIWIDFDSAITHTAPLSNHERYLRDEEMEMVEHLAESLAKDAVGGKLMDAYIYYYGTEEPSRWRERYDRENKARAAAHKLAEEASATQGSH